MSKLTGKVAVVTGASKGIGAGIAKGLAAAGAAVVVNYASSREGADRVVAEITGNGGKAIAVQGDVSKAADVQRLFAETEKAFGALDVLVNNAGVYPVRSARGGHRGRVPPRVQHQRPGADPGHAGGGEALRARRRQRDQHRLGREHAPPPSAVVYSATKGASTRHARAGEGAGPRGRSGSTRSTRAASRPRAPTAPGSSAATSRSRWWRGPRWAASASRTTSRGSRCSWPRRIRAG